MNISEAKQVLQRYRSEDSETRDSSVREALSLLEKSPELKAWFKQEQALNRAIASELESIEPPAYLRNSILQTMEATRVEKPGSSPSSGKTIPFLNWTLPLAAAAALVFALILFLPREHSPAPGENFPESLAYLQNTILEDYDFQLEKRSDSLPSLQAYLASYGTPSFSEQSSNLMELNPLGCLRLKYKSVELGLICFEDGNDEYHVISASKEKLGTLFPNLSTENLPAIFESGKASFKVWVDEQNVNILTHQGSNDRVARFF